jgi:hypothetical protein
MMETRAQVSEAWEEELIQLNSSRCSSAEAWEEWEEEEWAATPATPASVPSEEEGEDEETKTIPLDSADILLLFIDL